MGDLDEKDTILQEISRQLLDSYHCSGKACTMVGFLGFPLALIKKNLQFCIFFGALSLFLYAAPQC